MHKGRRTPAFLIWLTGWSSPLGGLSPHYDHPDDRRSVDDISAPGLTTSVDQSGVAAATSAGAAEFPRC